jgi:cell division protein ZapA
VTQKLRYKAIVDGVCYIIISSETKEHLNMVTQIADEQFCTLKQKVKGASGEQTAILLAINAINDQLKKQASNIILIKKNEGLKNQLLAAQKQITSLEMELELVNQKAKERIIEKQLEPVNDL